MPQYRFALKQLNGSLLREQAQSAGLPVARMAASLEADAVVVDVSGADLTAPQQATLATVITNHNGATLTAAQQAAADAEAQDATDRATLDAFDNAMANFIGLANPTAAQTANAAQAQARAWRYVVRRLRRLGIL